MEMSLRIKLVVVLLLMLDVGPLITRFDVLEAKGGSVIRIKWMIESSLDLDWIGFRELAVDLIRASHLLSSAYTMEGVVPSRGILECTFLHLRNATRKRIVKPLSGGSAHAAMIIQTMQTSIPECCQGRFRDAHNITMHAYMGPFSITAHIQFEVEFVALDTIACSIFARQRTYYGRSHVLWTATWHAVSNVPVMFRRCTWHSAEALFVDIGSVNSL